MQMIQSSYLIDLLSTITQRNRSGARLDDKRSARELCDLLLTDLGDVSFSKVSRALLAKYRQMSVTEQRTFFDMLAHDFDIDADTLAQLATDYAKSRDPNTLAALTACAEPPRQELLRRLNRVAGATADLVAMRCDLLAMIKDAPHLAVIDQDFLHLFRSWFNQGFLVLRRINWDSPASILEKIIEYEAVHAIDSWDDLRRRLLPDDRRCYAYFHPAMPDEPLIFVEVALTDGIAGNIQAVLAEDRPALSPDKINTAVFYSISNCQKGLRGISFGNSLIKQVVEDLKTALPQLTTFVTLSPIPGFRRWAEQALFTLPEAEAAKLAQAMAEAETGEGDDTLRGYVARYLITEKHKRGGPLDPVARFHLGNGALIHDIHIGADRSANGLRQSCGAMVNYLYDLAQIDPNIERHSTSGTVAHARPLATLLKSHAAKTQT
ncbi:malonyl-CoA decarboxylase [Antarctobacter heliothermus]|uniref:Malonyl-CoA decarboxylase n=1 Tax=Antarctobacter heliothermus TaxID=74033 RepID=A0A239BPW1_9RHOB|nr:malonyl-CoA decarboxylase [Antarctobacter heliothermus]SNS09103.1 malonyl-CoA decarboxylase [Antarctobacter heliothermus]